MKALKTLPILSLIIILSVGFYIEAKAQQESDVVVMLNGEEKEGKVTGINNNAVKFVYSGETLEYELSKEEINKIQFASGREEVFNEASSTSAAASAQPTTSTAEERKNKIAVLPFDFTTNDPGIDVEPMSSRIQTACANSLRENTSSISIQPPMTTNALLAQNNISAENIKAISPQDMAVMLGVEFVVYGSFDLIDEGAVSSGSTVTTYNDKKNSSRDSRSSKTKSSGSEVSSTSASSYETYDARLNLDVYNDQGSSVYSDSKRPVFAGPDAYDSPINFLVKRTPWGSKHK